MFTKSKLVSVLFTAFLAADRVSGRERWLERDNRPVFLHPRRFGQEQPAVLEKLRQACPGEVCGNLAGQAVTPLLAAQPECSQQDMADAIIDASKQFDAATQQNMIAIAVEYRQAEKNTPPDFTTNPPTLRNSVFCQKAPKNPELDGLVQAQDPANDPNIFFDPALQKSVRKGEQPNTSPFNGGNNPSSASSNAAVHAVDTTPVKSATGDSSSASDCSTAVTVTVTGINPAAASATNALTVTAGAPAQTTSPNSSGNADFGSCTTPEIEFGAGFDNRRETSFQPADKASYPHDSAQNINIITQFICDTLTNSCKANQAAKDLCATAQTAASSAKVGTGAQADAFNAAFGIQTNFVDIASVDNQGNVVPGTGAGTSGSGGSTSVASNATATSSTSTGGNIGDFGSCSTPEIEFGAGFDNRKETSFQPADRNSFPHGSAQNIAIIANFICDQLTNSCNADQAAKDTCTQASDAASSAAPAGTGAQADAFNAAFGLNTNFADVQQIDDKGEPVGNSNAGGATQAASNRPATLVANPAATPSASTTNSTSANLQTFSGALGGVSAPAVTDLGNGKFQVEGNSDFNDRANALVRSCDIQNNKCADAANASGNRDGLTVQACNNQQAQCKAAAA